MKLGKTKPFLDYIFSADIISPGIISNDIGPRSWDQIFGEILHNILISKSTTIRIGRLFKNWLLLTKSN